MKIGLALGGGGARGAAHIGVCVELTRLGIQPHLITGTSIGGMVGALWAAGLTADEMTDFFTRLNLGQMYGLPGSMPALTSNAKIEKLLIGTLGHLTFADLSTPLAVVTTDLISRQSVVLDEGDLISAVLATIAIPIVLPPVERDGQMLVDGGLLNNTPFDIARARGATAVIAVDLSHSAPYGTPTAAAPPPAGIVAKALALTQRRRTWQIMSAVADIITAQSFNARLAISQPDVLLRPYLGTIGLFDFHRWQEGIEAGCTAVREAEAQLWELVGKVNETRE
ncbi:MAG: patatin-like phospholipase family protein [Anaerolineae bacterium]